jgi:hypothetical protein
MRRAGVLGNGVHRTFEHISRAMTDGVIANCAIAVACANRPDVPLFASAERLGIPSAYLDGRSPAEIDAQALRVFREHDVEFVVLLGYGKRSARPCSRLFRTAFSTFTRRRSRVSAARGWCSRSVRRTCSPPGSIGDFVHRLDHPDEY